MAANETVSIDVLINTAESTKSLTELRQVTKQLQDQLKQTGLGAADINKIETALSGTRERVEDINAAINAGKDGGIQGFASLGRNIAGSFGVATGALGLFGSKNEELNAIINKVNASVALLSGIQAAADVARDAGILRGLVLSKAKVVATEVETAETVKLTIAQRALNLVMSANPIALIVTAVLAAVAAYQLWTSASEDNTTSKEEENKALAEQNRLLDESTARLNEQLQTRSKLQSLEISIAKEKGASLTQVYNLEKKQINDLILIKERLLLEEKAGTKEFEKLENELIVLRKERALLEAKFANDSKKQFEEQAKLRSDAQESLKKYYETLIGLSNSIPSNSPLTRALIAIKDEQDKLSTSAQKALEEIVKKKGVTNQELIDAEIAYNKKIDEIALNANTKRENTIRDYVLDYTLETDKIRLDIAKQRGERTTELEIEILKKQYDIKRKNLTGNEADLIAQRERLDQEYYAGLFLLYEQERGVITQSYKENLQIQDQYLTDKIKLNTTNYNQEQKNLLDSLLAANDYLDAFAKAGIANEEKANKDRSILQERYDAAKTASTLTYLQESKAIIQRFRDEEVNFDRSALEKQLVNQRSNEQSRLNSIQEYAEKRQAIILADITLSSTAKEIASAELVTEVENLKTAAVQKGAAERTKIIADEVANEVNLYAQLGQDVINAISAVNESKRAIQQNELDVANAERQQDYVNQVQGINDTYAKEITAANGNADLIAIAEEKKTKAKFDAELAKAKLDNEAIIRQNEIAKRAFENNKKLQIATAIIQTAQGATAAFASLAGIPIVGPVLGGIAAAAAVVSGTAQINTIRKTQFVGNSTNVLPEYSGALGSSGGNSGTNGSSNSQFVGGFDFNNSSLFGQAYPFPMSDQRVYVLESDITSTQDRVATIEDRNTF